MIGMRMRIQHGDHTQILTAHIAFNALGQFGQRIDHQTLSAGAFDDQPRAGAIVFHLQHAIEFIAMGGGFRQQAGIAQRVSGLDDARAGGIAFLIAPRASERQPHGGFTAPAGEAHRVEHIAARGLAGTAGRAGTDAHAGRIEQIEQFLAGKARHRKIDRGRHRYIEGRVEHDAGKCFAQGCGQAFALCVQRFHRTEHAGRIGQLGKHGAETGDAGHVLGARALTGFLAATGIQGREWRTFAHVQQADALGRIQLVATERKIVDAMGGQIERLLAECLYAIDQPQGVRMRAQNRFDAIEIGDRAGLVVDRHRADQHRALSMRGKKIEVVTTALIDRNGNDFATGVQDLVPVAQGFRHRLVFGGAVQQQVAYAATGAFDMGTDRGQHRRLDRLGGATGEQDAAIGRAQHASCIAPRAFHHCLGTQAGAVGAARIAELFLHRATSGLHRRRQGRRGGIGIKINISRAAVHGEWWRSFGGLPNTIRPQPQRSNISICPIGILPVDCRRTAQARFSCAVCVPSQCAAACRTIFTMRPGPPCSRARQASLLQSENTPWSARVAGGAMCGNGDRSDASTSATFWGH